MKKSIGFFACSNGFGHYKRISIIAEYLSNDYDITIYGTWHQMFNLGGAKNCRHVQQHTHNIRWDKTLSNSKVDFKSYKGCLENHKKDLLRHDYVISDNIVGILDYRSDAILSGSFFWKDVFFNKFGENKITDFDNKLLDKHNPLILTNKYAETGSIKDYKNKVQFGFGCKNFNYKEFKIDRVLTLKPSLNYLQSYIDFFKTLNIKTTDDFSKLSNIALMCRPGLGIITHCVENHIPLIALYDENDSTEIIELAHSVENLNIGFKQNIKEDFNSIKFSILKDNSIYKYNTFEKEGYKQIASFLKNKL
jgi:hypothetical protein